MDEYNEYREYVAYQDHEYQKFWFIKTGVC